MLALAVDTLRRALRMRGAWLLLGLGVLVGWGGLSLAILALGQAEDQARALLRGTSLAWAGLVGAWLLARVLDQDRLTDLGPILDASRAGAIGRLLGRWLGATLGGTAAALAIATSLLPVAGAAAMGLSLLSTSIVSAASLAAWTLCLSRILAPGVAFGIGLAVWVLGHLPWGSPALLPPPDLLGRVLAVVLPHPDAPPGATILVLAGLLALGMSTVRTGSMLRPPGGGRSAAMG